MIRNIVFEVVSVRRFRSGRILSINGNPINSVLFRVRVFVNASLIRFMIGIEYMGRRLRRVYVGAIAILFIFVVMIVNLSEIREEEEKNKNKGIESRGRVIISRCIRRVIKGIRMREEKGSTGREKKEYIEWYKRRDERRGIQRRGQIMYTEGKERVLIAGRFLRVARVGSIGLTRKVKKDEERKVQEVEKQISRSSEKARVRIKSKNINKW